MGSVKCADHIARRRRLFGRSGKSPSASIGSVASGKLLMLCVALSFVLPATSSIARLSCCRPIRTSFGFLNLDSRDVPVASALGRDVQRAAHDILGLRGVRFMIVDQRRVSFRWGDSTRNGLPIYPWRFAHGTVNVAITPPDAVLRHEIGHDLLQRYVVPSTRSGQYGTDAPDWMDEAVAVAFESPEDQSTRRCDAAMLRKSGKLLPIKRFLTMTHPDLAAMQHPAPGASSAAGFVYDPTASIDTPAFYAMSIAVPEYFSARTHDQHWLADIIGAYRAGVRLNPATLLGGEVDDNEINTDEVDRNFVSWLARDARYRCVRARIAKSGYRR